ncbi:sigma-54-dependent transcriptional regulator [Oceanicella actignis]|uniref:DNA-binding transcriptional response regulator, NtrC family, contains REC, AAA-type ATPase, and a Fis-type DNA-binding domains n=1 Tax=Oceanicella actignis TaxID=1189325 RepID=A0A1M7T825_9RHOB|nr:response regulator [Oceanicella actignis]SET48971.1 two component, sigma54 specific, transcriptional regulator, Fis family [Oceanicella actignis]SHN66863.1 DNA-binding transcriptional response regulator, NtrC family, contains REC, AAA-type ATPase, and a Fis-type DNA-binding domains [Oceanicella actignis]
MTLSGRYLVLIEDDAFMGGSLTQRLELEGAEVTWVRQAVRGVAAVRTPRKPVDAVICDIRLPDGSGEQIFQTVSQRAAPPPFLFITGQGDIDQAVRLLKAGAGDYLTKPFEMADFLARLALILRPAEAEDPQPRIGVSAQARQIEAQLSKLASGDDPLLIRGAPGLGKGRIAQAIHARSERRAAPFVPLDAMRAPPGVAELDDAIAGAGEGTLFVNGVGRLDADAQARLLDALRTAPLRLVAACGARIEEKVEAGAFRADLFYALAGREIVVPPLARRPEDAVWLAGRMFEALNRRRETPLRGLSELALAAIRDHDWPGNGRELRARLRRAVEAAAAEWIGPADLFPELYAQPDQVETLTEARERAERRQILRALARTDGRVGEAAAILGVSRTTLWEKMRKLGL